jgi:hypothetical protein
VGCPTSPGGRQRPTETAQRVWAPPAGGRSSPDRAEDRAMGRTSRATWKVPSDGKRALSPNCEWGCAPHTPHAPSGLASASRCDQVSGRFATHADASPEASLYWVTCLREFDLGHVEPRAVLGRVMDLDFSASRLASIGSNASYSDEAEWTFRLPITTTSFSALRYGASHRSSTHPLHGRSPDLELLGDLFVGEPLVGLQQDSGALRELPGRASSREDFVERCALVVPTSGLGGCGGSPPLVNERGSERPRPLHPSGSAAPSSARGARDLEGARARSRRARARAGEALRAEHASTSASTHGGRDAPGKTGREK